MSGPVQIACDIGGYHHDGIAMTIGALVLMLQHSGDCGLHPIWQVHVIALRHVTDALDWNEAGVAEDKNTAGERVLVQPPPERLGPREVGDHCCGHRCGQCQGH